jgi:hypothetical protein
MTIVQWSIKQRRPDSGIPAPAVRNGSCRFNGIRIRSQPILIGRESAIAEECEVPSLLF